MGQNLQHLCGNGRNFYNCETNEEDFRATLRSLNAAAIGDDDKLKELIDKIRDINIPAPPPQHLLSCHPPPHSVSNENEKEQTDVIAPGPTNLSTMINSNIVTIYKKQKIMDEANPRVQTSQSAYLVEADDSKLCWVVPEKLSKSNLLSIAAFEIRSYRILSFLGPSYHSMGITALSSYKYIMNLYKKPIKRNADNPTVISIPTPIQTPIPTPKPKQSPKKKPRIQQKKITQFIPASEN